MAEAADRYAWHRTMALVAAVTNPMRDKDRRVSPIEFFPWGESAPQRKQHAPVTPAQHAMLSRAFPAREPA